MFFKNTCLFWISCQQHNSKKKIGIEATKDFESCPKHTSGYQVHWLQVIIWLGMKGASKKRLICLQAMIDWGSAHCQTHDHEKDISAWAQGQKQLANKVCLQITAFCVKFFWMKSTIIAKHEQFICIYLLYSWYFSFPLN